MTLDPEESWDILYWDACDNITIDYYVFTFTFREKRR